MIREQLHIEKERYEELLRAYARFGGLTLKEAAEEARRQVELLEEAQAIYATR